MVRASVFLAILTLSACSPGEAQLTPDLSRWILASFPNGTFLENLTTLEDRTVLYTSYIDHKVMRTDAVGSTAIFVALDGHPSSIVPYDDGYLVATHGHAFTDRLEGVEGTVFLLRLDADGYVAARVPIPGIGFPNGMHVEEGGTVLVADTSDASVWRIDPATGDASVFPSSPSPKPYPGEAFSPAANGVTVSDGYFYVSSSSTGAVMRAPMQADGTAGRLSVVMQLEAVDDFVVLPSGGIVAATHADDLMYQEFGGMPTHMLDGTANGVTAVAIGKGALRGQMALTTTGKMLAGRDDEATLLAVPFFPVPQDR